jgi:hypothetical protein
LATFSASAGSLAGPPLDEESSYAVPAVGVAQVVRSERSGAGGRVVARLLVSTTNEK